MREKRKLSLVVGLLVTLLLLLGTGWLPVLATEGEGHTVGMKIDPATQNVTVGDTFAVDVWVTISAAEAVNTAGAHINFDPNRIEVVSITANTTALPTVLGSTFNNTLGTIDYSAGAAFGGTPPTEDFILATLNLKAKGVTGDAVLTFVYVPPVRVTIALAGPGTNVLDHGFVFNGSVTINVGAASQLGVSGITDPVVAGTASGVTVTAQDAYGNVATNYAGTIHFTSSDAQATLPADYAFQASDNGVKTFSDAVTMKTVGEQSVTATDMVTATITGEQTAITVTPAIGAQLVVSGIADPIVAGTASGVTLTALDEYGNVDTTYTGTIHFTSSDAQATLPADYAFQASDNGVKTFSDAVTMKTVGEQWVKATDTANATITGEQTAITVSAAAVASQLGVSGITDPVVAGIASGVTVTARDAYGNVATNYAGTIHFTSSDTQATLPADYTFVGADHGVKTFGSDAVTMKTVGEQSVTATDTVTATITGQQTGITVTAAAVASQLVVSGITDPVAAGIASNVTVMVTDAYGNIITSYTGTIRFTSSDAQATLPGNYTFLLTDHGVKTFSSGVTLKTAGEQSVTATDTVSSVFGQQTAITVTTATAYSLVVTGITDPVAAGTSCSVTVTVKDAYGNTVTGYTGKVHFTSSDAQATLPADYTFVAADNGVKTLSGVILKTAGEQWVKATDTVTTTVTGQQTAITVTAAAVVASRLVVSGITDPLDAGTASNVTVKAVDAYNNTVTGYIGKVHFTSSDAQATLPADYTFVAADNGSHTFVAGVILKTAGEQWVRATDTVTATITGEQSGITVTGKGTNWWVIIGGIIGGLLLIGIIVYLLRRRR